MNRRPDYQADATRGASVDWSRENSRWMKICRGVARYRRFTMKVWFIAVMDRELVSSGPDGVRSEVQKEPPQIPNGSSITCVSRQRQQVRVRWLPPVETMLGDTAWRLTRDECYRAECKDAVVAVDRSRDPLTDEHVDQEFGKGAVKITPAHDPNDYEWAAPQPASRLLMHAHDGAWCDFRPRITCPS